MHFKTVHVSAQIVGFYMKSIHIGMRILTLVVRVAAVVTVELMVAVDMALALVVVMVLPVALLLGVFAGYAAVPRTHIRSAKSFSGGSKADFLIIRMMATTRVVSNLLATWLSCRLDLSLWTSCMVSTMLPCTEELSRWTVPSKESPPA